MSAGTKDCRCFQFTLEHFCVASWEISYGLPVVTYHIQQAMRFKRHSRFECTTYTVNKFIVRAAYISHLQKYLEHTKHLQCVLFCCYRLLYLIVADAFLLYSIGWNGGCGTICKPFAEIWKCETKEAFKIVLNVMPIESDAALQNQPRIVQLKRNLWIQRQSMIVWLYMKRGQGKWDIERGREGKIFINWTIAFFQEKRTSSFGQTTHC